MKEQKHLFVYQNSPRTIPSGTGSNKVLKVNPKDTPALAKAKIGIIQKAT